MSNFAIQTIEMMNDTANFIGDLSEHVPNLGTRNHQTIFIEGPDQNTIDTIVANGGIIADQKEEHGILFCVPSFWIADASFKFNEKVLPSGESCYVRLVIPNERPIIVHSKLGTEVVAYPDGGDLRTGKTYTQQSNISFPFSYKY